jgi:ABC-type transport system involved in cytochrome bd biosynthesis fused ATPase/permease subunit
LDAGAVTRLMRGLAEQPDPPTILVVSHDPQVLENADRVYQVQGGVLTQQGVNYADAATA